MTQWLGEMPQPTAGAMDRRDPYQSRPSARYRDDAVSWGDAPSGIRDHGPLTDAYLTYRFPGKVRGRRGVLWRCPGRCPGPRTVGYLTSRDPGHNTVGCPGREIEATDGCVLYVPRPSSRYGDFAVTERDVPVSCGDHGRICTLPV